MLTVIFVRHGESTANVDRIFANRPHISGDLTSTGIAQAEARARSLEGAGVSHIFTSPLPRAMQTAGIVGRHLGLTAQVDAGLREYDVGEDEGFPYGGTHAWRWERYEGVQRAWREGDRAARHPGGESLDDLQRRFAGFMERLRLRDGGDVVLAVSHGGLLHAALPAIFGSLPADIALRLPLDHGDRVVGELRQGDWHCTHWGAVDAG